MKPISILAAVLAAVFALAVWAVIEEGAACTRAGGHLVTKWTYTPNGPAATSFCLSADGRVLE